MSAGLLRRVEKLEDGHRKDSDESCLVMVMVQEGCEAEALEYASTQGYDPGRHWIFQQKFTTSQNDVPYIGQPQIAGVKNLSALLDDIARNGRRIYQKRKAIQ